MMRPALSEPEPEDGDDQNEKEDETEQQGVLKRTEENKLKYIFLPERKTSHLVSERPVEINIFW
jgi:hypothetical protein